LEIREHVQGVAKLGNEIYVLSEEPDSGLYERDVSSPTHHASLPPPVMFVFEDQNPYRFQTKFEMTEINRLEKADHFYLNYIESNEKENCIYVVSCYEANCIWKITRETGDQHRIIKWLTTDFNPRNLSVTNDGHLLLIYESVLMIYGPDTKLIRTIDLPKEIENVCLAVKTPIGNFIIIHDLNERKPIEEEETMDELVFDMDFKIDLEERAPSVSERLSELCISEVTNDGRTVRRSSNDTHSLYDPVCLSHDSDNRVFVVDKGTGNARVILLDSDLNWSRIIYPAAEDDDDQAITSLWRLCFDEEKKQLIEGKYNGINIYKLSYV